MVSIFSATDSVLQTQTHTHNQCMIPAAHIVLMNIQHDIRYSGGKNEDKKETTTANEQPFVVQMEAQRRGKLRGGPFRQLLCSGTPRAASLRRRGF